jgi:hypothetical protein
LVAKNAAAPPEAGMNLSANDRATRITRFLSEQVVVESSIRVRAQIGVFPVFDDDANKHLFSGFAVNCVESFFAGIDASDYGFPRQKPVFGIVANMGDMLVQAFPVWFDDAINMGFFGGHMFDLSFETSSTSFRVCLVRCVRGITLCLT